MKFVLIALTSFSLCNIVDWKPIPDGAFKKNQLRYSRVREAYNNKSDYIKKRLVDKGINSYEFELFIRIFKKEEKLETWVKHKSSNEFILFKSYDFCAASGELGPKRKQGDYQVPEGFYYVDRFNPASLFHLSLGISYPNQSDRILGSKSNLGGDIFLHGACASIGCVAITDDLIEELFILSIEAKTQGQSKIPVHIFPTIDMNSKCTNTSSNKYFWCNLKEGYLKFIQDKSSISNPKIDSNGKYIF